MSDFFVETTNKTIQMTQATPTVEVTKKQPAFIEGYKTLYVDVDDTLAMGDLSEYDFKERLIINYVNGPITVVPNQKNVNLLTLFYKLGYTVIVWSKTGADWAKAVTEALEIQDMVAAYLTKPTFILDDQEVTKWIGPRRWRDPKGTLK